MTDAPEAIVQLRRGGCEPGACPVYSVSVFMDGTVIYEGRSNVAVVGQRRATLPAERVSELIVAIQEARFLDNPDNCCSCPDSLQSSLVMIDYRPGSAQKSIVHDQACRSAPLAMNTLTSTIERLTTVERWTTASPDKKRPPSPARRAPLSATVQPATVQRSD
jgi:Domain of unknown function (DUF6438)